MPLPYAYQSLKESIILADQKRINTTGISLTSKQCGNIFFMMFHKRTLKLI